MLVILMNRAWTVKEFLVGSIIIALSAWLLYVVDEIVWSAMTWLCTPRSLRPIIMAAFTIVVAPVVVFIASFFAAIIIALWMVIRAGGTSNVVLELPISFFGVGI